MDFGDHAVDYMAQAHWNHLHLPYWRAQRAQTARAKRLIWRPISTATGLPSHPTQQITYDTLVICIGSLSNDFGTQGVKDSPLRLETQHDAKQFHSKMVNACIRAHNQTADIHQSQLHVAIIGAGATGVELAAELHRTDARGSRFWPGPHRCGQGYPGQP
jgi:NADH dehydrogenase